MLVYQTPHFKKAAKKLQSNQKKALDKAILQILQTPSVGTQKKGDLSHIRVYKFKMVKQLTLLAYLYDHKKKSVKLVAVGSHENFYRGLKLSKISKGK